LLEKTAGEHKEFDCSLAVHLVLVSMTVGDFALDLGCEGVGVRREVESNLVARELLVGLNMDWKEVINEGDRSAPAKEWSVEVEE
jgi:hypothetical protein